MQKGGLYLHKTRGADMARGTREDATWHARPRGCATRTHAQMWRGHVAGPRESMRTPGWCLHGSVRGWQVMGPWVSGLRLDSWGGNANALFRPILYTYLFHRFPPCGTMFPVKPLLCRTRGSVAGVGCDRIKQSSLIVWTGAHLIAMRSTCANGSRRSCK